MFTYETAWAGFDDETTGSLEQGKDADMVILNRNPLAMNKKELLKLKTEKLFLRGRPYKKNQNFSSLLWNAIFNRRK